MIRHDVFENVLLKGLIYLHDISQARIGGAAIQVSPFQPYHKLSETNSILHQNLREFERLVGSSNLHNVVLVTTKHRGRPTKAEERDESQRWEELKDTYWAGMVSMGSRMMDHNNSTDSARLIVRYLLDKPNKVVYPSYSKTREPVSTAEPIRNNPKPKANTAEQERPEKPKTSSKPTESRRPRSGDDSKGSNGSNGSNGSWFDYIVSTIVRHVFKLLFGYIFCG